MDKFHFFDVFSKLLENKNSMNSITGAFNSIIKSLDKKEPTTPAESKKQPLVTKNKTYSQKAIIDLISKHEKLSKQIDENLKKHWFLISMLFILKFLLFSLRFQYPLYTPFRMQKINFQPCIDSYL